jgi:hypothetical protein
MTLLQNKFKSKNNAFLYIPIIIFIQIYIINMAYEGCLQNGSTYITDDSASSTSYKLSSIAFTDTATNGVKPSSGVISPFGTIGNYETTASNRGTGWHIENIWIASMNQLMFVIEMCNPNSQTALGSGVMVLITSMYLCE